MSTQTFAPTWEAWERELSTVAWWIACELHIGMEAAQAIPLGTAQQVLRGIERRRREEDEIAERAKERLDAVRGAATAEKQEERDRWEPKPSNDPISPRRLPNATAS